jgi:Bacteriophage Lambda NinG protein
MGPPEIHTRPRKNQAAGRRKRRTRRPRSRRCLLKGCEQRFHPRQARQRYCSEGCREAARKWSRRKAQERYRETAAGQQKRNGQSRRYRERVRSRKPAEPEAVDELARVITNEEFFRSFVRPARLLREVRAPTAKSLTALLFAGMPAGAGARARAGAALERGARLNPDILNHRLALA